VNLDSFTLSSEPDPTVKQYVSELNATDDKIDKKQRRGSFVEKYSTSTVPPLRTNERVLLVVLVPVNEYKPSHGR
jgi:hypothetical protein